MAISFLVLAEQRGVRPSWARPELSRETEWGSDLDLILTAKIVKVDQVASTGITGKSGKLKMKDDSF
ncbi:hypothetical protein [Propionimicrobium sp. PCR01-08-3]|uniref:hypothetical protein n=1 Tax=Propionimicrobium sp. PCR01-08-3 TaxID=3052086 RepID=UPI00255C5F87|nr:hypothetical protein [Propionimicrobium sp. PCR01-08-3]WIY81490.1 hypothetical protein QQ658_08035 [Propionimicrobium sp. PCR01-08-3]